jgi:hypothetical protein
VNIYADGREHQLPKSFLSFVWPASNLYVTCNALIDLGLEEMHGHPVVECSTLSHLPYEESWIFLPCWTRGD